MKVSLNDDLVQALDSADKLIEVLLFIDLSVVDLEVLTDDFELNEALGLLQQSQPVHVAGHCLHTLGETGDVVDGHDQQELQWWGILQVALQDLLSTLHSHLQSEEPIQEVFISQCVSSEEGKDGCWTCKHLLEYPHNELELVDIV